MPLDVACRANVAMVWTLASQAVPLHVTLPSRRSSRASWGVRVLRPAPTSLIAGEQRRRIVHAAARGVTGGGRGRTA